MKISSFLFVFSVTCSLLATAAEPINDQIVVALEEPAANSTVSGVGNLRGWAVGPDGIDYVEFYVDGVLKKKIPYGAARGDIGKAYPDLPDSRYSGFSSAYAYGLLTPGKHILKVRAVSSNGKFKETANAFSVTRFHKGYFPDPNAMDISSSSASQQGAGFLLENIKVEGTPYDVKLEWQVPSQQFSIVDIAAGSPPHTASNVLNDTGIVSCSDDAVNGIACPVATHPLQDAEVGRDVDADQNDDSDGHAGFSFSKLAADGSLLPASASHWSCVKDNVTGLTWEVKTGDGGLRDKENTYTWYNPDNNANGGNSGTQDGGDCTGSNCDTYGYVQAVADQMLCGYVDWRMPTKMELENILNLNRYAPAIDADYFPNTKSAGYWSASPFPLGSDGAWLVTFSFGLSGGTYKSEDAPVRLVRGGD